MGHFNGKIGNAYALSRELLVGIIQNPHILNQPPQFSNSLYNLYGATATIKGSLHESTPIVKRFLAENCSVKSGPRMAVCRVGLLRGLNVKFLFSNPEKAHPCAEPRRLTYYA